MNDEEMLDCFMDGFAKVAEDAGLKGKQVKSLLHLSVTLSQSVIHPEEFAEGFLSVMGE